MQFIDKPITLTIISQMAKVSFGDMVKAVVDVREKCMVIDINLHADAEAYLLAHGSLQEDLWGINLYPDLDGDDFIEFDSMINLRPSQGNNSRSVDDPKNPKNNYKNCYRFSHQIMKFHPTLTPNQWHQLSLVEQFANIGSEIERAINWRRKHQPKLAHNACYRSLELFDLSLSDPKYQSELNELARARELWLDFFLGNNQYHQTDLMWHKYIMAFTLATANRKL